MAICGKCGTSMGEDSLVCQNCGHRAEKSEAASNDPAQEQYGTTSSIKIRPTGGTAIALGWTCMGLASILVIVALSKAGNSGYGAYGGLAALDAGARAWPWLTGAGWFFDSGVFLLVIGYILRAIWFLPGPDRKAVP